MRPPSVAEGVVVATVRPRTPAAAAGLAPGDRLIARQATLWLGSVRLFTLPQLTVSLRSAEATAPLGSPAQLMKTLVVCSIARLLRCSPTRGQPRPRCYCYCRKNGRSAPVHGEEGIGYVFRYPRLAI